MRLAGLRRPARRPGRDAALLAAVVAAVSWAALDWYPAFYLRGDDFTGADIGSYCREVLDAIAGVAPGDPRRSVVAAAAVAALARNGNPLDGLAVGAAVGLAGVVAGVALWARAVAGRLAGAAAAVTLLAVAPVVCLGRMLTFYPLHTAINTFAAAASAWVLVSGTPAAAAAAVGLGALAAIADGRGVATAAVAVGAALLGAAWGPADGRRPGRSRAIGVAVVVGGLALGWGAGRLVPRAACLPLSQQSAAFVTAVAEWGGVPPPPVPEACRTRHDGACWGWAEPAALGDELRCAGAWSRALGVANPSSDDILRARRVQIEVWAPVAAVAGLLGLLGLARQPRRVLALLIPALPFAAALAGTGWYDPETRRLGATMVPLPVLLGVATAVVVGRGRAEGRGGYPAVAAAVLVGWALLVGGVVPGWWAPNAWWRSPFQAFAEHRTLASGGPVSRALGNAECAAAVAGDTPNATWRRVMGRTLAGE